MNFCRHHQFRKIRGILTDDSPFDFELQTQGIIGQDVFNSGTRVTITVLVPGDANCDDVVDLLDIPPFVDAIIADEYDIKADVN